MKLLEFTPGAYRGLPGQPVRFVWDAEAAQAGGPSIRFLVGRNGVGKTNLLRFLTSIFLALDENYARPHADSPAYHTPYRLRYRLHGDTITIDSAGEGRSGVQFTFNDEPRRDKGDIPARDRILPAALMVYSSGDLGDWGSVFRRHTERQGEDRDDEPFDIGELRREDEQSPYVIAGPVTNMARLTDENEAPGAEELAGGVERIFLVEQQDLKPALLAAMLDHEALKAQGKPFNQAFEDVLQQVGVRLKSFSLRWSLEDVALSPSHRRMLAQLYDLSTLPLKDWEVQLWVYDLDQLDVDGQSVLTRLSENVIGDPFSFYRVLTEWTESQILLDAHPVIEYLPPGRPEGERRLLLTDQLSDGEFAFLSRMTLIYLLDEDECLFLLDEPEVHFNDDWKRNLVDSIERAMRGANSEVVLVSHSTITLTDAFPDEVILLGKDGQKRVARTFGAEPGELLEQIFGAEQSVGERARQKIETAIAAAKQSGDRTALEELLDQVGPGYYRFTIVEELLRVSSHRED